MDRLIIDGHVLADARPSGVSHYAGGIVAALDQLLGESQYADLEVILIAPLERAGRLRSLGLRHIELRRNPIPTRAMTRLADSDRIPSMDRLFGRGVYLFPNFRTWPLRHSRAITSVHDLTFETHRSFTADRDAERLRHEVRKTIARADYISCLTHTSARELSAFYGIADDRLIVAPPGVDATEFRPRTPPEIVAVRHRYRLPERYFLNVGNMEPRKNQTSLVRAYLSLPAEVRDRHGLVLVGANGWKNDELMRLVNEATRRGEQILALQGRVTDADLPAVYSGASAFVFPSFYEGFGMPVIEAMACDTPVVLSDTSVMTEVGGDAPLYIDPSSEASLAQAMAAIDALSADERTAMATKGRRRASAYAWTASAAVILRTCRVLWSAADSVAQPDQESRDR